MSDQFDPAQWKSICAAAGVDVEVVTDAFGRTDIKLDRPAMERLRDFARECGQHEAAEFFTNCLNAKGEK